MNPRTGLAEFRRASQRVRTAKGQPTLKSRERALLAGAELPTLLLPAHPRFMANTLSSVQRAVVEGQFTRISALHRQSNGRDLPLGSVAAMAALAP